MKGKRLFLFAVLALLVMCLLFLIFVASTRDVVSDANATRTQNALEAVWDEELRLTLTAERGRK